MHTRMLLNNIKAWKLCILTRVKIDAETQFNPLSRISQLSGSHVS